MAEEEVEEVGGGGGGGVRGHRLAMMTLATGRHLDSPCNPV